MLAPSGPRTPGQQQTETLAQLQVADVSYDQLRTVGAPPIIWFIVHPRGDRPSTIDWLAIARRTKASRFGGPIRHLAALY